MAHDNRYCARIPSRKLKCILRCFLRCFLHTLPNTGIGVKIETHNKTDRVNPCNLETGVTIGGDYAAKTKTVDKHRHRRGPGGMRRDQHTCWHTGQSKTFPYVRKNSIANRHNRSNIAKSAHKHPETIPDPNSECGTN